MSSTISSCVQERGFDIDLRELGLAIRAQVFVAETLHDLVVAVEAGDHQQLLEKLRRLRKREKVTRMHARRHQIVARAFGRRAREHRRLDVDEAFAVEELAHRHRRAVAQAQVLLHLRAPQIEKPVLEAHGFRKMLFVHLERRRE